MKSNTDRRFRRSQSREGDEQRKNNGNARRGRPMWMTEERSKKVLMEAELI